MRSILALAICAVGQVGNASAADSRISPTPTTAADCPAVAVASHFDFNVAALAGGSVFGWGYNYNRLISPEYKHVSYIPFPFPLGLSRVVSLALQGSTDLALRDDGRVYAWGWEPTGTGIPGMLLVPELVINLDQVKQIAVGSARIALRQDGTVWVWGYVDGCASGDPLLRTSEVPIQIPGLGNVVEVASSRGAVHALRDDGTVVSWGSNRAGELGRGSVAVEECVPGVVPGLTDVVAISGSSAMYFLQRDGTVWAAGEGQWGEMGDCIFANHSTPVQVPGLSGMVKIWATYRGGFAMRSDGTLWGWGANFDSSVGVSSGDYCITATQVPLSQPAVNANRTLRQSIVLLADGTVQTAGWGSQPWNNYPAPGPIAPPGPVRMLRPGALVRPDGSLWGWGENQYGEVGVGSLLVGVPTLTQIFASGVRSADGGLHNSWVHGALKDDGTVWMWGHNNYYGSVGDGTMVDALVPKLNPFLSNIQALALGDAHALALTASGTIEAWGANERGQLGISSLADHSSIPVPIAGLTGVVEIAAGGVNSMARLADGTVWTWGNNAYGQLGYDSAGPNVTGPGRVAEIANAVAIRIMGGTGMALTQDGQVWTWGRSGRQIDDTWTPAPLPAAFNPARLGESGNGPAAVILRDGRVLAWGRNEVQQIGLDPSAPADVPLAVEVPALAGAAIIAYSETNGHAVFPDGEIWGWGENQYGQVGNGKMVTSHMFVDFPIATDVVPTVSEGNTLRAVRLGADVRISVGGASGPLRRVFRDGSKLGIGTTALEPDRAVATVDDRGAVAAAGGDFYYAVRGISSCSHTEGP